MHLYAVRNYSHSFSWFFFNHIYALNIIPNGKFEPVFLPIISFIKISVAEKVAKSPAELCQVVVMQPLVITGMRLSSADLTAAIDTASE